MQCSGVYSQIIKGLIDPNIRTIVLTGGTRSTKSYSAVQALDFVGRKSTKPRVISAVSETMPHLKKGVLRDFKNIIQGEGINIAERFNETDKIYQYDKAIFEFFSVDNASKAHGSQRDYLFVNEALFIDYEIYRQLAIRTSEKIIIDFNPAWEFWAHTKIMNRPDTLVIHSTYLDNDFLTAAQIKEIESYRESDPDWWATYGEGKLGSGKGLVIQNWDIVDALPPRATWKKHFIGVDFGWSNPTAIIHVVLGERDEVWLHEIAYERNMDNADIARAINKYTDKLGMARKTMKVICDEAEPKSISELVGFGVKAVKTNNKDIRFGLQVMNRHKKHYTSTSLNSIDENRKYMYHKNGEGVYLIGENPVDKSNHAKDAERYIFLNELSEIKAPSWELSL